MAADQKQEREGRQVLLALSASENSLLALHWVIDQYLNKERDKLTLLHIVCSLVPKLEVFHGVPGTSLGFEDPGAGHHEREDYALARKFITSSCKGGGKKRRRVDPVLERAGVAAHETLFELETTSAPPSALAALIAKHADERDADLVVVGSSDAAEGEAGGLGPVASLCATTLTRPLAIVR